MRAVEGKHYEGVMMYLMTSDLAFPRCTCDVCMCCVVASFGSLGCQRFVSTSVGTRAQRHNNSIQSVTVRRRRRSCLSSSRFTLTQTKGRNPRTTQAQLLLPFAPPVTCGVSKQDDVTGDGTTTSVLFTGELLRQAERYLSEGLHPRVLTEGFELAKEHALELLDNFRCTK